MATVSKEIADDIIKGKYDDDKPTRIVKYKNAWGDFGYGVTFVGEDIDRYMYETPYVREPEIYWER